MHKVGRKGERQETWEIGMEVGGEVGREDGGEGGKVDRLKLFLLDYKWSFFQ